MTFDIDANGIVNVSASDKGTGGTDSLGNVQKRRFGAMDYNYNLPRHSIQNYCKPSEVSELNAITVLNCLDVLTL